MCTKTMYSVKFQKRIYIYIYIPSAKWEYDGRIGVKLKVNNHRWLCVYAILTYVYTCSIIDIDHGLFTNIKNYIIYIYIYICMYVCMYVYI